MKERGMDTWRMRQTSAELGTEQKVDEIAREAEEATLKSKVA